jgi:hypothetical protein
MTKGEAAGKDDGLRRTAVMSGIQDEQEKIQ